MPVKASSKADKYANIAALAVDESVAGTVALSQINTGISIKDKLAWLINRIEWQPLSVNATQFNGTGDYLMYGICSAADYDPPAVPSYGDPALIDYNRIMRKDIGTAATGWWKDDTQVKDFSNLPGGGMLVPAVGIYTFVKGSGLAGVAGVRGRMFFTILELGTEDYWELVQSYRIYT